MRINADFNETVILRPDDREWVTSPEAGVDRQYLDRIGDEVARATTIVRYIPGSVFKPHAHEMGEEFLVLEGTFADEHGAYPAGTYIRNPPGTTHRPDVPDGCTILVKLRQFDPTDLTPVAIDTSEAAGWEETAPGVKTRTLHEFEGETVRMVSLAAETAYPMARTEGAEILITKGGLYSAFGILPEGSWLRAPEGDTLSLTAGDTGATFWIKTGHLSAVEG